MFEELKKKILKSSLLWSIILIIAGLGLAGWNAMDAFYAATGYVSFTQLTPDQIKSQLVDIDVTEAYGCFLIEGEENTKTHQQKITHLYYIIPTGDIYATDYRYMSIRVPASYESKMDAISDNTGNGIISDPLRLSGKIKKLSSEDYSYFESYFKEAGFSDEEIAQATIPYNIDVFASKASMSGVYIVLFGAGVALLIFGIFRIAKVAGGSSLKKLRKDIASTGYSESMIDSDYHSAKSFDKKGTLKIGRLMTYYISGSDARAIPNNKIMWAYQNTVTHRTNGVKTGTTYNVMIFDEITPKGHSFSVANESIAQDMLALINTMLPWVVVGYSDELKKLYNKDRAQFLQLRYNSCEHIAAEPAPAASSGDSPVGGQP